MDWLNFRTVKRLKTIAIYRWISLPVMTLWVAQLKQIYRLSIFRSFLKMITNLNLGMFVQILKKHWSCFQSKISLMFAWIYTPFVHTWTTFFFYYHPALCTDQSYWYDFHKRAFFDYVYTILSIIDHLFNWPSFLLFAGARREHRIVSPLTTYSSPVDILSLQIATLTW